MKYCDTIILKISSRCNINCTYCYMYNLGDSSFKMQPKFMSEDTISSFVEKMLAHCKKNNVDRLTIILHGGEPLLMDKKLFVSHLETIEQLRKENIQLQYAMQTNGILIDEEWCEIFNKYKIGVGISLDGKKEINDLNRVDKKGNGTYDRVMEGIKIANKHLTYPLGILSVINPDLDPVEAYKHVIGLGVKSVDFLKLDKNYDQVTDPEELNDTRTADWFIKLFNYLFHETKAPVQLRIFDVIIHKLLGGKYSMDFIGDGVNNGIVIETSGEIEAVDVLKACGDGFTKTNLNIKDSSFDEALDSPLAELYYYSNEYLCRKCKACPVHEICGGGYLPHRYSSKNGFNNPSIYCNDLMKLITHIQNAVVDAMPEEIRKQTGIQKLTYENAQQIIEENLPSTPEPEYVHILESFRKLEHEVV